MLNLTVDIDDVRVDLVPDGVQDELEVTGRGAGEWCLRWWRGWRGCGWSTAAHTEHGAEISPVLGIADSATADRGDPVH